MTGIETSGIELLIATRTETVNSSCQHQHQKETLSGLVHQEDCSSNGTSKTKTDFINFSLILQQ